MEPPLSELGTATWDLWGSNHCPAYAGQFRPVITGFRPPRQLRISFRAYARNFDAERPALQCKWFKLVRAFCPQELISPLLLLLLSSIEICLRQSKLPLSRHLNPLCKWSKLPRYHAAEASCKQLAKSQFITERLKKRNPLLAWACRGFQKVQLVNSYY